MNTVQIVKRSELFLGLNDDDLQKIVDLPSCQAKTYQAQETIFEAGEQAKYIYVVQVGRVNLIVRMPTSSSGSLEQTVLRTITRGGVFGWSALVPPQVRIMSAVTREASKVVAISGNELRTLFDKDPRLGYEVMSGLVRVIGSRVWAIEQLLITGKGSPFL